METHNRYGRVEEFEDFAFDRLRGECGMVVVRGACGVAQIRSDALGLPIACAQF